MATEFNPGGQIHRDSAAREPMNVPASASSRRGNWKALAVLAAIAGLIVLGLFLSTSISNHFASSSSTAVTTGQPALPEAGSPAGANDQSKRTP